MFFAQNLPIVVKSLQVVRFATVGLCQSGLCKVELSNVCFEPLSHKLLVLGVVADGNKVAVHQSHVVVNFDCVAVAHTLVATQKLVHFLLGVQKLLSRSVDDCPSNVKLLVANSAQLPIQNGTNFALIPQDVCVVKVAMAKALVNLRWFVV